jgi:hypothetical protein
MFHPFTLYCNYFVIFKSIISSSGVLAAPVRRGTQNLPPIDISFPKYVFGGDKGGGGLANNFRNIL